MPAKSEKQRKFMQAVANNPSFAKKAGVPQSVGREYTREEPKGKPMMKRNAGRMEMPARGRPGPMIAGRTASRGMKSGGLMAGHKDADGVAKKGKTKARKVAMAKGGYRKGGKSC